MKLAGLQNISTGLYVGAKYVYVAQLKKTFFGLQLIKFGQTEIQVSAPSAKDAESAEAVKAQNQAKVEAIKRVLRENNITAQKVVTALPGKDVLIRYFQMPRIPPSEWQTAVKFEAKKYIPFKIEDLMWDFQVSSTKGKDSKMDVTFVAVKKEVAQNHLAILARTGLKPLALEPAPFSSLRFFTLGKQLAKHKPTAIVDVDYGMADINILKEKICYLTRDVSIPLEEGAIFEHLLNEIRMSLDYYEKLFLTEVIGKILLCGEVELKDWDKTLSQELKVPVEKASFEKVIKIRGAAPPLSSTIVIGLALRNLTKVFKGVNLYQVSPIRPKAIVPKDLLTFTPEVKRAIFSAVTLSCVGLAFLYLTMFRKISQGRKELEHVVSLRPKVDLAIESYSYKDMEALKKQLENKLSMLDSLIDKKIFLTNKFNELSKIIPPGVWLTDLEFIDELSRDNRARRSLVIRGIAYHQDPIQQIRLVTRFVSQLKENGIFFQGFAEIKLDSMVSSEIKGMPMKNFVISCLTK